VAGRGHRLWVFDCEGRIYGLKWADYATRSSGAEWFGRTYARWEDASGAVNRWSPTCTSLAFGLVRLTGPAPHWVACRREGDTLIVYDHANLIRYWIDLRAVALLGTAYRSHYVRRHIDHYYLPGLPFAVPRRVVVEIYAHRRALEPDRSWVHRLTVKIEGEPRAEFRLPPPPRPDRPGHYRWRPWAYDMKALTGRDAVTAELKKEGRVVPGSTGRGAITPWGRFEYIDSPARTGWFLAPSASGGRAPRERGAARPPRPPDHSPSTAGSSTHATSPRALRQ
jgi:hypothetical protein